MLSREQAELLQPRIRNFRLILLALLVGVAVFALVVFLISNISWAEPEFFSIILFGFTLILIVQAFVLPKFLAKGGIQQLVPPSGKELSEQELQDTMPKKMLGVWFTSNIVRMAILESAAFINLVFAWLEGSGWHLVVALIVLGLMITQLPSKDRVLGWIEDRLAQLSRGST